MSFQTQVDRNLSDAGYTSLFFFNSVKFLKVNNEITPISFRLNKSNKIIAAIHFSIIGDKAVSLLQAPFGGLDFHQSIDFSDIDRFLSEVLIELKARKINAVELRLPPSSYAPDIEALQDQLLKKHGFKICGNETNCHIEVRATTTFWSLLKSSEKNKLNRSLKAGFQNCELPKSKFNEVYDLVKENREAKGFPLTMERNHLEKLVHQFEAYKLFGCYDQGTLIACTVSIVVKNDILYNFYMADKLEYRSFSPLVFLNEYIYNWCVKNNFNQLDLGTVSVDGVINEGLFSFKKNLGAKVSGKIRFLKE